MLGGARACEAIAALENGVVVAVEKPPPASDLVRVLVEGGVVETATDVCAVVALGDEVSVVGESGEVVRVRS